jgi:hypothetical protein
MEDDTLRICRVQRITYYINTSIKRQSVSETALLDQRSGGPGLSFG